jgi:GxxExxY protein
MEPGQSERDPLTAEVIGAAIEVHRHLGPGLLESVYHKCLIRELELRGVPVRTQVRVPITYKGLVVENALLMDVLVGDELILELKSVERLEPIFEAQLLTYMRLSGVRKGLLLNFNSRLMKDGIKRMVL